MEIELIVRVVAIDELAFEHASPTLILYGILYELLVFWKVFKDFVLEKSPQGKILVLLTSQ
jgi:hypothetical protein